ncbi:hypothetical protein HJC23_013338 [Cyclotella cryptica]|uniref:Uncharacterized protein n=1 Tax=Cyclotella cryptica TaxID=29204 RepID=A0ABD3Q2M5_9STRA|eukprot:CCRYP_009749-RA/>CCRYP_009749-RA protein AED:0.10 eAED:0.10 QI:0/-1/0/1/-1/1/1/0/670
MKLIQSSSLILFGPIFGSFAKEIRHQDGQDAKLLKTIRIMKTYSGTLSRFLQTSELPNAGLGSGNGFIGSTDQLGGCPDTCSSPEICSFYESQAAEESAMESDDLVVLKDACNAGTLRDCSPSILTSACGLCGGGGFSLGSLLGAEELDMICNSCEFLDCCDGSSDFDVCSKLLPELEGSITESAATISLVESASVTPEEMEESVVPSGSPTLAAKAESISTSPPISVSEGTALFNATGDGADDFIGGTFSGGSNESVGRTDDFVGGLFGSWLNGSLGGSDDLFDSLFSSGFNNESSGGSDGFLAGVFGSGFNETDGDDFFSGLFGGAFNDSGGGSEEFFTGMFGGGLNYSSNGSDTFLGDMLGSWLNESGGGLNYFLGGLFGGGFNESVHGFEPGNQLYDFFGGLLQALNIVTDGLLGHLIGENETQGIDNGNFSGWQYGGMLGTYIGCTFEDYTCPVQGVCDCINGDFAKCSFSILDDLCSSGAFFSCAPSGLEEICNLECPPPQRQLRSSALGTGDPDVFTTLACSMCHVARCCEAEGKALEECTMESGFDFNTFLNATHQNDHLTNEAVDEGMANSNVSDSGTQLSNDTLSGTGTDSEHEAQSFGTEGSSKETVDSNESMPSESTMNTEVSVSSARSPDLGNDTSGGLRLDFCMASASFLLFFLLL